MNKNSIFKITFLNTLIVVLSMILIGCAAFKSASKKKTDSFTKELENIYKGNWNNGNYSNAYLNFSISLPPFWENTDYLTIKPNPTIDRRYQPEVIVESKSPPKTIPINVTIKTFGTYQDFEAFYKLEKKNWILNLQNLTIKEPIGDDSDPKLNGLEAKLSKIRIGVSNVETLRIDKYFIFDNASKMAYTVLMQVDSKYYPELSVQFDQIIRSFKVFEKEIIGVTGNESYQIANKAYDDFKFAQAIKFYEYCIEKEFSNGELYKKLAYSFYSCSKPKTAIRRLKDVLESKSLTKSGEAEVYLALGDIYYNEVEFEKGEEAYLKAEKKGLNSEELYLKQGFCYLNLKQTANAIRVFEKAIMISPNSLVAIESVAPLYEKTFKYKESVLHWEKALEIRKNSEIESLKNKESLNYIESQIGRIKSYIK